MSTYQERIAAAWYSDFLKDHVGLYLAHMFKLVKLNSDSWDHNHKVVLRAKPDPKDFELPAKLYSRFGIEGGSIAQIRRDLKHDVEPTLSVLGIKDYYLEDAAQSIKYGTVHKTLQDVFMSSYPPFCKQLVGDLIQYAESLEPTPTAHLSFKLYDSSLRFGSDNYGECLFVLRNPEKFDYSFKRVSDASSYRNRSHSSHQVHEFKIKLGSVSEEDLELTAKALKVQWGVASSDLRDIREGIDAQGDEDLVDDSCGNVFKDINGLLRTHGVAELHRIIDYVARTTESLCPGYSESFYGKGFLCDYKQLTRLITGDQAPAFAAGRVDCDELTRIAELSLKYGEENANKILDLLYGDYKP